jgi:hypothetical protein
MNVTLSDVWPQMMLKGLGFFTLELLESHYCKGLCHLSLVSLK